MFATLFRAAGASFFVFEKRRAFFEKARFGIPKPCLLRFSEPQALFFQKNDMPFLKKVCFGQKLTFMVNIWSILVNIWSNVGTYLPTIRYCVLYGTAYLPTRTVRILYIYIYIYIYIVFRLFWGWGPKSEASGAGGHVFLRSCHLPHECYFLCSCSHAH